MQPDRKASLSVLAQTFRARDDAQAAGERLDSVLASAKARQPGDPSFTFAQKLLRFTEARATSAERSYQSNIETCRDAVLRKLGLDPDAWTGDEAWFAVLAALFHVDPCGDADQLLVLQLAESVETARRSA